MMVVGLALICAGFIAAALNFGLAIAHYGPFWGINLVVGFFVLASSLYGLAVLVRYR